MPKKEKEIIFKSLPKNIQKALRLIRKVKSEAIMGVGRHDYNYSPVANGFGVFCTFKWDKLGSYSKRKLKEAGWNGNIYRSFMNWYDGSSNRNNKEDFLRTYLS